jgi:hypothetical protein
MTSNRDEEGRGGLTRLIADNSLSIALFSLFAICIAAQSVVGWRSYGQSLAASHYPALGYGAYLETGTFQNAVFSNWQAAVLQLGVLIAFSTVLRQRGAAHSRKSDEEKTGEEKTGEEKAGEEKTAKDRQAETLRAADEDDKRPGPPPASSRRRLTTNFQFNPLRKNWLYNNSLSLALFGLFVLFFALHAWTSNRAYNEEQMLRHQQVQALLPYLGSSTFWFSCFQTWEAEFFAIGVYIVLSIFLRQERSPESKKPDAGDADTGDTND